MLYYMTMKENLDVYVDHGSSLLINDQADGQRTTTQPRRRSPGDSGQGPGIFLEYSGGQCYSTTRRVLLSYVLTVHSVAFFSLLLFFWVGTLTALHTAEVDRSLYARPPWC